MYIAGRQLNSDGKVFERGDRVDEASTWPAYVLSAHIRCGSILDLTDEQWRKIRAEVKNAQRQAKEQRLKNDLSQLERQRDELERDIALLVEQRVDREKALKEVLVKISRLAPGDRKTSDERDHEDQDGDRDPSRPQGDRSSGDGAAVTVPPPTLAVADVGPETGATLTVPDGTDTESELPVLDVAPEMETKADPSEPKAETATVEIPPPVILGSKSRPAHQRGAKNRRSGGAKTAHGHGRG